MTEVYIVILFVWSVIGFMIAEGYQDCSLAYITRGGNKFWPFLNPLWLWKSYRVNVFGVILLTLMFNLICPVVTIVYWIVKLIKWLCTAGRKQDEKHTHR